MELQSIQVAALLQVSQYWMQWEQVLGSPVQKKVDSVVQTEEHPSPLIVLLSSHCSVPTTKPSPQIGLQKTSNISNPSWQVEQAIDSFAVLLFTITQVSHPWTVEQVGEQVLLVEFQVERVSQVVQEMLSVHE